MKTTLQLWINCGNCFRIVSPYSGDCKYCNKLPHWTNRCLAQGPTYLTDENGNELGFDGDSVCYCPRIDVEIDQQNNIIRLIE